MKRILAIMTIIVLCFSEFSILAPQVKAPETVIFFDDFDDIYLKPEWIWVDPWEDCSYSLDWDPGYLTIDVPYDGNDLWTYSNVDAPRMVQSANGDFIIETMVVFNPQYSSQGAGILVWKDSDNYLRLDRLLHGEADQVVDFSGEMAGEWFYLAEMSYSDIITYLRLERTAGLFTASYSGDGTNWDFLGEIVSELSDPVEIGLFALNQWQNNPVYADFDYFKVSVAGVPQGGLVGYWRFDEGSGTTAADSSGSGNMGDLRNGPAWVEGRRGEALRFDGVDDYATINENTDLDPHTSDWTVSAWVNIGALVGGGYTPYGFVIVGKRQAESDSSLTLLAHWGTSPTSQAMFGFLFDGSNQAAGARSPLMNVFGWHYVVGVRRGGDLYVYVDGAEYGPNNFFERGTNLTANTDVSSSTPIHFAHHGAWQLYYNGTLDDVRIYSRALSQQQIEADMNSHVGYWKFDEGSGSVAADSSGMGNDGTLDGPVWTNGKQGKALDFDGINDYVWIEASNSLDVTSQVTVEAWVYPRSYVSSTGDAPHIVSRADSSGGSIYILAIRTGAPKVEYAVNPFPDAHQSTATLQLDAWTHLAMTYDGSYVRLYINGGFDSSYSLSGSIDTTDNWLAMGCKPAAPSGGSAFFNGTIDEVRIYSRALNQHEIQEDIIASVSANIITEWSIPVVVTSGVPGSSIITDSLGNIWFALQTKDAGYSSVVKFEPTISRFTTYDLRGGISDQCWGLDIDSTGKLWFAMATGIAGTFEWGGIGVLNPATSTVHEYKNPLGGTWGGRDYIGLTVDKNDRVWITGSFSNTIQMFDPVTLNYTVWSYPGSNGWNVYPYLTVTSDGSVWFPEVLSNRIAKLVPSTSVFTEYTVPPEIGSFSDISCVTVQVDSSGTIGFNEPESNNLALLNPNEASGTNVTISPSHGPPTASTTFVAATNVTVANPSSTFVSPSITSVQANSLDGFISHAVPTPSSIPNAVAFDSNRNLWFAESQGNNIGVLLRASSQIAEYALPTSNAQFRGKTITIDKSGDVWFVESGSMKLGRLSLSRDIEISIAPSDQTTSIGGEATYSISIRTNSSTYDTITLSLQGLDNSWYSFNRNNFTIVPGETANVQLGVTVPENPENVGTHLFIVTVSSGWTRRTVNGVLHVLLNPIMYDLEPKDNATIGSTDLLISWRTSANATSEVFIKRISEPNFNHTIGGFGKEHYMHVYNLSRNTDYVWYAYSQALSGGNISSNERNLHVSNGITFTQDVYTFNVERDYAQHETVAISDTDSQSHDVKVEALNPYSDLIVGFVGAGSIDRNMTLLPDETKYVDIYIHAQDAQQQNYTFTIKLTNIGIEQIVDYALVELYVRPPNLNLTLIEESIDSTILSKTITARNYGDTITDLYIDTSDELAGKVFFRPTVYHAYVPRGGSLTFEAIPVLTVDFTGCQGHVLATGAGQVIASLQVNFTLPVGKGVFTVRVPEVSIEFSQYYDTDNSPNTNPLPNSPVETYIVNGKRAIASQIIVDVYQNGGPASDANVSLTVWNETDHILSVEYSETDFTGKAMFVLFGKAGNYSYQAELVGYDIKTEKRSFSTDDASLFEIHPRAITWLDASDGNSTYDLSQNVSRIILDQTPFVFRGQQAVVEENTTATLYIRWDADSYKKIQIQGRIENNRFVFNTSAIPAGSFNAIMFSYSPSYGLAFSDPVNITCIDWSAMYFQGNYSYQLPFPLNTTHIVQLNINHVVTQRDSQVAFDLFNIEPTNSDSEYLLTYLVLSNKTLTREFHIEIRTPERELYNSTTSMEIYANKANIISFRVPVRYGNGALVSEFNSTLSMSNCSLVIAVRPRERYFYDLRIWVGSNGGILENILGYNPDPYGTVGTAVSCGIGSFIGLGGLGLFSANALVQTAGSLAWDVGRMLTSPDFGRDSITAVKWTGLPLAFGAQAVSTTSTVNLDSLLGFGSWSGIWRKAFVPFTITDCISDYSKALEKWWKDGERIIQPVGTVEIVKTAATYCTNNPVVKTEFPLKSPSGRLAPLDFVRKTCIAIRFSLPWERDTYSPHDVSVLLNGQLVGQLSEVIPEGYYLFEVDPTTLVYPSIGTASNTITLATTHMNGGHYVIASDITIMILYKSINMSVVASSQEEANATVVGMTQTLLANRPDPSVFSEDIKVNMEMTEGINALNITLWNLGASYANYVLLNVHDGNTTIANILAFIPPFGNITIPIEWNATAGSHAIYAIVDPENVLTELSEENNQASKNAYVHPLPNIALTKVQTSKTIVGQGYSLNIDVAIANYGDTPENTDVTIYANATVIATFTDIYLTSGTITPITFIWNTAGFAKGNYTISAYATPAPGEIYTTDNTLVKGVVSVTTPGDVNADGIVDILDVSTVSAHWYPGPPQGPLEYDPNLDINGDGEINIVDVSLISAYWTGPPKGPLAP